MELEFVIFIGYLILLPIIGSIGATTIDLNTQSNTDNNTVTIDYIDYSTGLPSNKIDNFSNIQYNESFIEIKPFPTQYPVPAVQTPITRGQTKANPTHKPDLEPPSDSLGSDYEWWPISLIIIVFIICAILGIVWSAIRYKLIKKDEQEEEQPPNKVPEGLANVRSNGKVMVKIQPKGEDVTNVGSKENGVTKAASIGESGGSASPKSD